MTENPDQIDADGLWGLTNCGGCARKAPALVTVEFASMAGCATGAAFMSDVGLADLQGNTLGLTGDFITPVVPNPVHFGQIAAANALSDIYAAGMLPRFALAIACVPEGDAALSFARALAAGSAYLAAHGCFLIGGHSVTDAEPKLGFAVVGQPNRTGRIVSHGAQSGDALILAKPLGVGILTSACKAGLLPIGALDVAVQTMLSSNSFLPALIESPVGDAIHAATDVTGYGLLGHLWELCARSAVGAEVMLDSLPVLPGVRELADAAVHTSPFRSNSQACQHCGRRALRARSRSHPPPVGAHGAGGGYAGAVLRHGPWHGPETGRLGGRARPLGTGRHRFGPACILREPRHGCRGGRQIPDTGTPDIGSG
jgi:selenide,water dikinase